MRFSAFSLTALFAGLALPAQAQAPNVVASIKPIHSLAAAVMEGVGEPELLLDGTVSPHTYALRPSDAHRLSQADLVFWVAPDIESFLQRTLAALSPDATVVQLSQSAGLTLLPYREGGMFEAHDHGHDGHDHGHAHDHAYDHHGHDHEQAGMDGHLWLDPANAAVLAGVIADALAERDPQNAETYRANADLEIARLEALREEIAVLARPVAGRPFIVFHDAFQYFEAAFGFTAAASVTISPEIAPGARRIAELQARIGETQTRCLVAEPQFQREMVDLLATAETRTALLDPIGADIEAGPDLYQALIRQNAEALVDCLTEPA